MLTEDVSGFDWTPTIHPDDVRKLSIPFGEAMRNRTPFTVEARYRRADGEYRVLETTARPRFSSDGEFLGMIGVNVDVTELRFAEAAVRQETRLLEILNRTGAAIAAELELEKVVQSVTDAGVELSGAEFGAFFYNVLDDAGESYMLYSLSGAPREAFRDFPMPRATKVFRPTFEGEGIVRADDILAHADYGHSEPYWGMPKGHLPVRSYLAVPVKSRSGEVIGGLFFGHREQGVFKEEHERLLSGIAGQAAIAIDNARLFQKAERENRHRAQVEERLRALNETLETRVIEEIAVRRQAEAALSQAQKMEAIGQLTGGVAHDFNNLLQVISGNLQMLSKDVAGNQQAERRVGDALIGVGRGAKLASQLLAFGRRQALEPKTVNIGRLVASMDEMLRRTLGELVEIETVVSAGLWNSFVDPSQIENAILNLAINGRDAMEGGGKLTIEAGNSFVDDAYVRNFPDATSGQYVVLSVTDTGTGIPPEIIEKVFEPFFSTKGEGRGTGLGLSMVYGFVKQSGGHVRIYSELGHGTTVKLYLPRTFADEDRTALPEAHNIVGGSETILVAEDDEAVRDTACQLLTDLGYRVLKAKDAQSALTVLESGAAIDLLFTDVVMPGPLRVSELARRVRERYPHIAVLFASGYTENAIVHGGRLDSGVELLAKPYSQEALARKIRQVLEARSASAAPRNASGQADAGQWRVLVVEDEALIQFATIDMLQGMGHHATGAGTAFAALRAFEGDRYDIVMTDVGLPDMDGIELARRLRAVRADVTIILATGHGAAKLRGVPHDWIVLSKPFDEADLQRAIGPAAPR